MEEGGGSALSKARYLATTSGGSWFNAAFSYKVRLVDNVIMCHKKRSTLLLTAFQTVRRTLCSL